MTRIPWGSGSARPALFRVIQEGWHLAWKLSCGQDVFRFYERTAKQAWMRRRTLFRRIPIMGWVLRRRDLARVNHGLGSHDAEKNEATRAPDGETMALQAMWAMEFYTPSQIDGLFGGLRKLGWDKKDYSGNDLTSWINRDRSSVHAGGWYNLGTIKRNGSSGFGIERTAPLPENVEYAEGAILSLTSSLTCIILLFVYSETFGIEYTRIINRERKTYARPLPNRGYSINDPYCQKRDDIQDVRNRVRRDTWSWFRANLPGIFSSEDDLPVDFPTCELVTTKLTQPFPYMDEFLGTSRRFLDIVGLNDTFDAWKLEGLPGLRFCSTHHHNEFHAILAAKEQEFVSAAEKHSFESYRRAWIGYTDYHVQRLISRWGLIALLSFLQRRVNALRDSTRFRIVRRKEALALLTALGEVESRGLDVGAISSELRQFTIGGWFRHDVADMSPVESGSVMGASLLDNLRSHIREQIRWLRGTDEQVRRTLTQQGLLIATRENIQLQRTIEGLTRWVAVVTVLAIIVSILIAMEADPSGKLALAGSWRVIAGWLTRAADFVKHVIAEH